MADLYTSQVHLKRLLSGQSTPAFTPASEAVLKMLDPDFFPGMGALKEDENGKLQCPVRGCGEWHLMLYTHLNAKHQGIGGSDGVRAALSLGPKTPLMSASARALLRRTVGAAAKRHWLRGGSKAQKRTLIRSGGPVRKGRSYVSMATRNYSDSCPAQLQQKIEALAKEVGRSPSANDMRRQYGPKVLNAIERYFGTWNAAKAACGLTLLTAGDGGAKARKKHLPEVLECLRVFYAANGDLPSSQEVADRSAVPYVPSYRVLLSVFGAKNWAAAMRSAVEHLGITSERYGAPSRRSA